MSPGVISNILHTLGASDGMATLSAVFGGTIISYFSWQLVKYLVRSRQAKKSSGNTSEVVTADDVRTYLEHLLGEEEIRTIGYSSRFATLRQQVEAAILFGTTKSKQVKSRIEKLGTRAGAHLFDAREKLNTALEGLGTSKTKLDTWYQETVEQLSVVKAEIAEIVDAVDDATLMREVDSFVHDQAALELAVDNHVELSTVALAVKLNQFSASVDTIMAEANMDRLLRGPQTELVKNHKTIAAAVEGLETARQKLAAKSAA
ncbi:MAG: hypothetical protein WC310_02730 [Patescibacteria group bacterium]